MNSGTRALFERRIVVCVGCGGVGKTTISAALALEAARAGLRTLVLTIDPARRLADALGVEELSNDPRALPRAILTPLGVPPEGSLSAVMLDMKRTFDELVERFADGPEARDRIMGNPIYQNVSDALAGSVEYSAMEKVYQLSEAPDYDLLVVDTPPAQHALDFLEAPQRMLEFLESRLVQLLIHPAFAAGRFGFRLFQRGAHRVFGVIEQITGVGFLEDISEFLLAFEGMSEGFRRRALSVRGLLEGPEAAYVLVAGPGQESVAQSHRFLDRLEGFGIRLEGVIANRVHLWPDGPPPAAIEPTPRDLATLRDALAREAGQDFPAERAARAAADCAEGYAAQVRRDEAALETLRTRVESRRNFWRAVPELDEDAHDLEALARLGSLVSGEPSAPPASPKAQEPPKGSS